MPKRKSRSWRSWTPDAVATSAERAFWELVQKSGRSFAVVQVHIRDSDVSGECWTNAFAYAKERRLDYAEGWVQRPGRVPEHHAWVVNAFGMAIEVTPGYERATNYRGIVFSVHAPLIRHTERKWRNNVPRASVVETALAVGIPPEKILETARG